MVTSSQSINSSAVLTRWISPLTQSNTQRLSGCGNEHSRHNLYCTVYTPGMNLTVEINNLVYHIR